jgi:putative flippase GtrA
MFQRAINLVFGLMSHKRTDDIRGQTFRQIISGSMATAADLLVFKLCLVLGVHVLWAPVVASTVGMLVNFVVTRHFVYGETERQKKSAWLQFALYAPSAAVSIALTQLILLVFSVILSFDPMVVKIVSVPLVFVWTLLSGKYLIFTKKKKTGDDEPPAGDSQESVGEGADREDNSRRPPDRQNIP